MSKSFLDGNVNFPDKPSSNANNNGSAEFDEETVEFLSQLGIPGHDMDEMAFGLGAISLDERLVHVSHLATLIYCHRKFDGDKLSPSAAGSVEAAWDIFNRTKDLVDAANAKDEAEAHELIEKIKAEDPQEK